VWYNIERLYAISARGEFMENSLVNLTYEIELEPGEKLTLPASLTAHVGAGRWLITIQPLVAPIRSHSAFLSSYAPEDEELYDDYPPP
jgi:hypothetical protein